MAEKDKKPVPYRWIVIGVLGVTFMLVFKDELGEKIRDADKISVGLAGVSIEKKTKETPLGTTVVSAPTDGTARANQPAPNFQSPIGFAINWPQDGSWSSHPDYAATWGAELVIAYNRTWGAFVPNVNVTIEPTNMKIRAWMAMSNPRMGMVGFTVTSFQIDEQTNSAVRVMRGQSFGMVSDGVQRIIIRGSRAFIATATRPVQLTADPKLWQDLNSILNSFRAG